MAIRRDLRNSVYGFPSPVQNMPPAPIRSQRAPAANDHGEIGQLWIHEPSQDAYVLVSTVANVSTWLNIAGGSGAFNIVTATVAVISPLINTAHIAVDSNNLIVETTTFGDLVVEAADQLELVAGEDFTLDSTLSSAITVTGASEDLTLASVGGSVIIDGSEAVATAVTINASDVAGGVTISSGTAGVSVASTGGTVQLSSDLASSMAVVLQASDVAGGIDMIAGSGNITATATGGDIDLTADALILNGIHIYTGAGAPAAALCLAVGDLYIRTDPGNANERLYIGTVIGTTWTNVSCAA